MAQVPAVGGGATAKGGGAGKSGTSTKAGTGVKADTAPGPNNAQQPGTTQQPSTTQQRGTMQQPGFNQQSGATQQSGTTTQQPGNAQQPGNVSQGNPNATNMSNAQGGVGGTSSAGTISAFRTNEFSLQGTPNGVATNYQIGPDTTFTDSEGRSMPRERFNSQTPATVYYMRSGDTLVATRVVAKAFPPPFSAGTVSEVSPGVFVIEVAGASATPVRYVNNKTTNYVDQNGEAVPPEMIKLGTPVKIYYTKVGDTLVATKVEVERKGEGPGLPKPPIPEDPNTTTTTTTTIKRQTKP